ncbi:hypothetical protein N7463_004993 [Penicillium fimorum]|uniref:Uncharacterized protein n=1 Tax=Penicillium fimorum TaxID=1882269 RepID=A0A9W9XRR5_9EURO|nr:hypothetical protein N7463_004993 [Penicillium fimorum]
MYEDSNATKDRRVDCLTSFETSCLPRQIMVGQGREISSSGREAKGVQPHMQAFHLRDISGKREVEPSQRPVILRLDRHTCPNEDTQQAITIPFTRLQKTYGMGNAINRGNQERSRSGKEFQVQQEKHKEVFREGGHDKHDKWHAHTGPTRTRAGQITTK